MDIYLALAHHPVLDRLGCVVATSVTNLDIHDLARISRTYDVRRYFVTTPNAEQRELVRKVIDHWVAGQGRTSNPTRAEAFERVEVVPSLEAACLAIADQHGQAPLVIGTSAKNERETIGFPAMRDRLSRDTGPALIVFGTGWGLASDALAQCDVMLPPIEAIPAKAGYNHLPVRAAVAIILDRLFGAHEPGKESLP
jgi:hypothetical protein